MGKGFNDTIKTTSTSDDEIFNKVSIKNCIVSKAARDVECSGKFVLLYSGQKMCPFCMKKYKHDLTSAILLKNPGLLSTSRSNIVKLPRKSRKSDAK